MNTLQNKKPNLLTLLLLTLTILVLSIASLYAQGITERQLKGQIMLSEGEKEFVSVKTRRNGASLSSKSGLYARRIINLPDTITFSVVGYVSAERVITSTFDFSQPLNIRLVPDIQQLSEIEVSTGYQKLKPNEINGTVSVINEKSLNATQGTNILDRIIGQSSGLLQNIGKSNPNAQNSTNITIRGLGTINGPLDPLVVLDGYIYEGNINNINPNDIESVSVLKDASAASIWGARAGNGVIVITSKKGKLNQKMQIGFSASLQLTQKADLLSIPIVSAAEYIEIEKKLFRSGYFDDRIIRLPHLPLTPAVEILLNERNGKLPPNQALNALDLLGENDVRKSYLDNFYTHPVTQQYSLNLRGGAENYSYLISGNYDKSISETYGKSDKINVHLSNQFKPVKNLNISTNLYITSANSEEGMPAWGTQLLGQRNPSYLSFEDASGNPLSIDRTYRSLYTDTAGGGKLLDWRYYPTQEYRHNSFITKRNEIYGSISANYKIFNWLNAEASYQLQRQNVDLENFSDSESFNARDIVNSFSQLNRTTGVIRYIVPKGGIMRMGNTKTYSNTGRFQLSADQSIGAHVIKAIAGVEARDAQTFSSGSVFYGYQRDPLTSSNVDAVNYYPNFITGSLAQIGSSASPSHTNYRFLSFYGNASYSYLGKYLASGSIRKDGSNIFGANTNDKWKPLWSAGIGWAISKEQFYNIDFLPVLRINATFGYTGNVDLTKTSLPIAGYATNPISGFPYTRISSVNNPDLKWEQLSQLDVKVSFETRAKRLSGTISYFQKRGSDLYGITPYDYTGWAGRSTLTRNVADMKGYGIDAELFSRNIIGEHFGWESSLYFNFNKDKTVKYHRPANSGIYNFLGNGTTINPNEGMPLYGISSYKWGGLDGAGNPQGYLAGKLSTNYEAIFLEASTTGDNLVFNGVSSPKIFGSIINSFSYKRISLAFNISYRLGYYFTRPTLSYSSLVEQGQSHPDYSLRWQNPGDEATTNVPSFIYPIDNNRDSFYQFSEVNVLKADNLRLQYINLSYRFNSGKWRFPMRNLEFTAGVQNAGILWRANKEHLDPDYAVSFNIRKNYVFTLKGNF
ncbi:SusC/RagA family TonB-linked outer membrane protein [Pedobacter sp. Leaf250]|uniref:SusC/RagA family TonB-linked outer membrane protein n=1 Tax=Pedobacter sp. Leaf250 TaxID=2876559 RepID=UPI001E540765|nr:SusC/RagA family TonB-linked outer membrane protein [Pedobacter sp. Leaf250]